MKRFLLIYSLSSIFLLNGWAYNFDLQQFAERDIMGSARYISLAGAMTAVGGDASAVGDNPAALGIFRRDELSITFDWQGTYTKTQQLEGSACQNHRLQVPQVALIVNVGNNDKQQGVVANNFMIGFRRVASICRDSYYAANSAPSIMNEMSAQANGKSQEVMYSSGAFDNINLGWLGVLGAQCGLLTSSIWTPLAISTAQTLSTQETGQLNEYTLDWGMNISNMLYIGLGAHLTSLSYSCFSQHRETFGSNDFLSLQSQWWASGIGFNGSVGAIYHPVECLRLGASFSTPTWYQLSFRNYSCCSSSTMAEGSGTYLDAETANSRSSYQLPLRSSFGVAFQVKQYGLISLQYDYEHCTMKDVDTEGNKVDALHDLHTLKVGLEGVIKNHYFLHVGYAYRSTFLSEEKRNADVLVRGTNSTRTDVGFAHPIASHYIGAGFGYRNSFMSLDIAYQWHFQQSTYCLMQSQIQNPLQQQDATTHRVIFTIGWHNNK